MLYSLRSAVYQRYLRVSNIFRAIETITANMSNVSADVAIMSSAAREGAVGAARAIMRSDERPGESVNVLRRIDGTNGGRESIAAAVSEATSGNAGSLDVQRQVASSTVQELVQENASACPSGIVDDSKYDQPAVAGGLSVVCATSDGLRALVPAVSAVAAQSATGADRGGSAAAATISNQNQKCVERAQAEAYAGPSIRESDVAACQLVEFKTVCIHLQNTIKDYVRIGKDAYCKSAVCERCNRGCLFIKCRSEEFGRYAKRSSREQGTYCLPNVIGTDLDSTLQIGQFIPSMDDLCRYFDDKVSTGIQGAYVASENASANYGASIANNRMRFELMTVPDDASLFDMTGCGAEKGFTAVEMIVEIAKLFIDDKQNLRRLDKITKIIKITKLGASLVVFDNRVKCVACGQLGVKAPGHLITQCMDDVMRVAHGAADKASVKVNNLIFDSYAAVCKCGSWLSDGLNTYVYNPAKDGWQKISVAASEMRLKVMAHPVLHLLALAGVAYPTLFALFYHSEIKDFLKEFIKDGVGKVKQLFGYKTPDASSDYEPQGRKQRNKNFAGKKRTYAVSGSDVDSDQDDAAEVRERQMQRENDDLIERSMKGMNARERLDFLKEVFSDGKVEWGDTSQVRGAIEAANDRRMHGGEEGGVGHTGRRARRGQVAQGTSTRKKPTCIHKPSCQKKHADEGPCNQSCDCDHVPDCQRPQGKWKSCSHIRQGPNRCPMADDIDDGESPCNVRCGGHHCTHHTSCMPVGKHVSFAQGFSPVVESPGKPQMCAGANCTKRAARYGNKIFTYCRTCHMERQRKMREALEREETAAMSAQGFGVIEGISDTFRKMYLGEVTSLDGTKIENCCRKGSWIIFPDHNIPDHFKIGGKPVEKKDCIQHSFNVQHGNMLAILARLVDSTWSSVPKLPKASDVASGMVTLATTDKVTPGTAQANGRAIMTSNEGDCGGLIIQNGTPQRRQNLVVGIHVAGNEQNSFQQTLYVPWFEIDRVFSDDGKYNPKN